MNLKLFVKSRCLTIFGICLLAVFVIVVICAVVDKNAKVVDRSDSDSLKYCNLASCGNSLHPMCHNKVSEVAKVSCSNLGFRPFSSKPVFSKPQFIFLFVYIFIIVLFVNFIFSALFTF